MKAKEIVVGRVRGSDWIYGMAKETNIKLKKGRMERVFGFHIVLCLLVEQLV